MSAGLAGVRLRARPRRVSRRRGGISIAELKVLDDLARTLCMTRAGAALVTDEGRKQWWGACQRCGCKRWLSWCHVFTRATRSIRWDPDNFFAWCRGCHRYLDQHWELKQVWVMADIGPDRFDQLLTRSRGLKGRQSFELVKLMLRGELAVINRR